EQSGTDLGAAWRDPAYDDSAWPIGAGLFYAGTNTLPAARNTPLALGPTTYYFRTRFNNPGAPAFLSLTLWHGVDDAVVLYLNGREINRFNLPSGLISYTNNASSAISSGILRSPITVALTNLLPGVNVLAAEVHQAVVSGDDVAFGAELTAAYEAVPRIPFQKATEEWLELFNRGTQPADLTGWRLDE